MDQLDSAPPELDLDRVWVKVAAEVWRREPGRIERLAARLLQSPGLARALCTTPGLLLQWLIASVVVLGAGAAVTAGTGQPAVALAAPVVAGVGIACAYGPGMDPAWELSRSMAVSDSMVLLVRSLAVFALNALLTLLAAVVSSTAAGIAFSWLLPMTAVSLLGLAAARVADSANAGIAAAVGGWTVAVLVSQSVTGDFAGAVNDSSLTTPYVGFAACCLLIVLYPPRFLNPRGNS
ncbi:hypothetical protein ACFYNO_24690 [Kitasatospora sp. NPDC006697]|uniref:hypothetical protein n=1 Tax=Kitasatospora sp. NPDC006697 TaxID=3364020 RepID=UPI003695025A